MAGDGPSQGKSIGERFPDLKDLEKDVERAKLQQALAEARAAGVKGQLPDLDVALTKDTITVGDKSTGLARVLIQRTSALLADDVADLALDAARSASTNGPRRFRIRVIGDPSVFRDVDTYQLIDDRLESLNERIDAYAPPVPRQGKKEQAAMRSIAPLAAGTGVAVDAIGLASKLLAHDYQVSGREVAVDDMAFDLQIAHRLTVKRTPDEDVEVAVERVLPTPPSKLAEDVTDWAREARKRLVPAVEAANVRAAELNARFALQKEEIEVLDARILKLAERVPDAAPTARSAKPAGSNGRPATRQRQPVHVSQLLADFSKRRDSLAEGLPGLRAEAAATESNAAAGRELLTEVEGLISFAFTPGADGTRPPIVRAARAESLMSPGGNGTRRDLFLYARLIGGGIDQVIESKLGPDRWQVIAGTGAEFALVGAGGTLLASRVLTALRTSEMKLGNPESFKEFPVSYAPLERKAGSRA